MHQGRDPSSLGLKYCSDFILLRRTPHKGIKPLLCRGCFCTGFSLEFANSLSAQKQPEQWGTWTRPGESEAWCSTAAILSQGGGGNPLQTTGVLGHEGLEASVP